MNTEGRVEIREQPQAVKLTRSSRGTDARILLLKVGDPRGLQISIEVPDPEAFLVDVACVLGWVKE